MTTKACVLVAAASIAWGLKQHYAGARADDLWWILSPTAHLVSLGSGVPFTLVTGEGYFSRERLFLIEKSCAGINFMIAAFGMLVFTLLHRVRTGWSVLRVLGVSLVVSYAAAVATNAARISMALWLGTPPPLLTAFSAADIHRIEGIVVYFGGLVLVYGAVRRLDARRVEVAT